MTQINKAAAPCGFVPAEGWANDQAFGVHCSVCSKCADVGSAPRLLCYNPPPHDWRFEEISALSSGIDRLAIRVCRAPHTIGASSSEVLPLTDADIERLGLRNRPAHDLYRRLIERLDRAEAEANGLIAEKRAHHCKPPLGNPTREGAIDTLLHIHRVALRCYEPGGYAHLRRLLVDIITSIDRRLARLT